MSKGAVQAASGDRVGDQEAAAWVLIASLHAQGQPDRFGVRFASSDGASEPRGWMVGQLLVHASYCARWFPGEVLRGDLAAPIGLASCPMMWRRMASSWSTPNSSLVVACQ